MKIYQIVSFNNIALFPSEAARLSGITGVTCQLNEFNYATIYVEAMDKHEALTRLRLGNVYFDGNTPYIDYPKGNLKAVIVSSIPDRNNVSPSKA